MNRIFCIDAYLSSFLKVVNFAILVRPMAKAAWAIVLDPKVGWLEGFGGRCVHDILHGPMMIFPYKEW